MSSLDGFLPWDLTISVKLVVPRIFSLTRLLATKVPLPGLRSKIPSSTKSVIAWRTVIRLTSKVSQRSRSLGRRCPIFQVPSSTSALILSCMRIYAGSI